MLGVVATMSESAQVLLVTDDALVAAWAVDQGSERAAVVTLAPAYA